MTHTELKELWQMVWKWRAEMREHFPTPPRDDSLPFAFTESGEGLQAAKGIQTDDALELALILGSKFVDSELFQNPRYKRNNPDKEHSIERELAQCAMMLLTAVPYTWRGWDSFDIFDGYIAPWTVRNIAIRVAQCMDVPSDVEYILGTVQTIGATIDLRTELAAELDRMREKHLPGYNAGALEDLGFSGALRVRIVSSKLPTYWYANLIGKEFDVWKLNDDDYEVMGEERVYLRREDCEIVPYAKKREGLVLADYEEGSGVG